jgi:TPR repeat protein
MSNVGWCFEEGSSVAENPELAVSWYQRSADLGNADGMRNLGRMLNLGLGVRCDTAKAVSWCDTAKAVSWFRRAVDAGDADAMFELGYCFAEGLGVARNAIHAGSWYQRAADNRCKDAIAELARCFELDDSESE